jgi:hypothetical protein
MAADFAVQTPHVIHAMLEPLVRCVLDDPAAELVDFRCVEMGGGYELGSSVYGLSGNALLEGRVTPWRLVLKVIIPMPGHLEPGGAWYWKREVLAYQTGLVHQLPGKLTAPRCYALTEQPDGAIWLWLEYLEDQTGSSWPLETYHKTAYHLGLFNGAYLAGRPLPDYPWTPKDWLAQYIANAAPAMKIVQDEPDNPAVRQLFNSSQRAVMLLFWDERDRLLALLDSMPQTFCHQDAFKGNLFDRGSLTVAVDWSYASAGPAGVELVPLVLASTAINGFPPDQMQQLEAAAFDGYSRGLVEAGFRPNLKEMRLAYCLSILLRYCIAAGVGQGLPALLDQSIYQAMEQKSGAGVDLIEGKKSIDDYIGARIQEGLRHLGMFRLAGMAGRAAYRALCRRF